MFKSIAFQLNHFVHKFFIYVYERVKDSRQMFGLTVIGAFKYSDYSLKGSFVYPDLDPDPRLKNLHIRNLFGSYKSVVVKCTNVSEDLRFFFIKFLQLLY
jgi:hypothetical protein